MHAFTSVESLRMNKKCTGSARSIIKQQMRQGQVPFLSISTDRGVLPAQEAAAKKIGGVPLFKIY